MTVGLTHFSFFCHSSESWNPVYSRFLWPWIPLFSGMTPIA